MNKHKQLHVVVYNSSVVSTYMLLLLL